MAGAHPWPEVIEIPDNEDEAVRASLRTANELLTQDVRNNPEWVAAFRAVAEADRTIGNTGPILISDDESHDAEYAEDDAIDSVRTIFPDVDREFFFELYRPGVSEGMSGAARQSWCQEVIRMIAEEPNYPRESHRKLELKRKRSGSSDGDNPKGSTIYIKRKAEHPEATGSEIKARDQLITEQETLGKLDEKLECQCCFDDKPMECITFCTGGDVEHVFCFDCVESFVQNLIGQGKWQPNCIASTSHRGSACRGEFTARDLRRCLDARTFAAWEKLEQEDSIRLAELEDLYECPFCDFKAIFPSSDYKDFQCENCKASSCRLCRKASHNPKSCEEACKDSKISIRHQVEEAMSEALIRTCKKCQLKFIKEYGCNKMACSKCGTMQCYLCGASGINYTHFKDSRSGMDGPSAKCSLYDDGYGGLENLHTSDVKKAEAKVLARILRENPELTEEDLNVRVSKNVERDEASRRDADRTRNAQRAGGIFMVGVPMPPPPRDGLLGIPPPPPPPPQPPPPPHGGPLPYHIGPPQPVQPGWQQPLHQNIPYPLPFARPPDMFPPFQPPGIFPPFQPPDLAMNHFAAQVVPQPQGQVFLGLQNPANAALAEREREVAVQQWQQRERRQNEGQRRRNRQWENPRVQEAEALFQQRNQMEQALRGGPAMLRHHVGRGDQPRQQPHVQIAPAQRGGPRMPEHRVGHNGQPGQQPQAQIPPVQQPLVQQPLAQQPLAQQPLAQQPLAQQPPTQQPPARQPPAQQPQQSPPTGASQEQQGGGGHRENRQRRRRGRRRSPSIDLPPVYDANYRGFIPDPQHYLEWDRRYGRHPAHPGRQRRN